MLRSCWPGSSGPVPAGKPLLRPRASPQAWSRRKPPSPSRRWRASTSGSSSWKSGAARGGGRFRSTVLQYLPRLSHGSRIRGTSPVKILVCGDRDWTDRGLIFTILDCLRDGSHVTLIEGHARGADQAGHDWAVMRGIDLCCCPADWRRYGRAAGPIRNRQMADLAPDLVVAFHDHIETSLGTGDMLREAARRGVPYALVWHEGWRDP